MTSKLLDTATKREVFETLYRNLTALQNSYQHLINECHRQQALNEAIELDQEDLNKNLHISKEANLRLERLKYFCALAILSEGATITEAEISKSVDEADYLLDVADIEIDSSDEDIKTWATTKRSYITEVKEVLLEILSFKIDARVKRGFALWQ